MKAMDLSEKPVLATAMAIVKFILEEGALPHGIDSALEDFGFPMYRAGLQ